MIYTQCFRKCVRGMKGMVLVMWRWETVLLKWVAGCHEKTRNVLFVLSPLKGPVTGGDRSR